MRSVIIHGKKVTAQSPRHGRPTCALWGVTRANVKFWDGTLTDWTEWVDVHPLTARLGFAGIPERRPEAWAWYRRQDASRPIYFQEPINDEEWRLFHQVP